jgi:ferredoxin-nitrite reductase
VNIHLTGCHNSCAQHYVADIGLLAAKVEQGEDLVEGYDLHVGGGAGERQAIGRLIRPKVPFDDLPPIVLTLLASWMERRVEAEDFQSWTARHSDEELASLLPLPLREGVGGRAPSKSSSSSSASAAPHSAAR